MSKYIELYPETFSGIGLIAEISDAVSAPWHDSVDRSTVEILYANRSANKTINSNFVKTPINLRSSIVLAYYIERWTKLWNTYKLQYNTLSPYSVTETGEHTKTETDSKTQNFGKKIVETATDEGTIENIGANTDTAQRSVYAYNSQSAVPSETSGGTTTNTGTETRDLSGEREVTNSGTDTENKNGLEEYEYSATKSGNLGFITPQDMIRKEFEIWAIPYFERVFEDVDALIALKIY